MFPSQEHKVGIINASPMSMGLFTELGAPKWHRGIRARLVSLFKILLCILLAPDEVKSAVASASQYCKVFFKKKKIIQIFMIKYLIIRKEGSK